MSTAAPSRLRRTQTEGSEPNTTERWQASYLDMVTVLMALFIVLYAISAVNTSKYAQLKDSLAVGFGTTKATPAAATTAVAVKAPATNLEKAAAEVQSLRALQAKISANLAERGVSESVSFDLNARGLTIRLVGSETYFASNQAVLSARAGAVLNAIGPALAASHYAVSVEGHADLRQPVAPYPTNWELSAARATSVLRNLVEAGGMPGPRISSVGYGDSRPLATGGTADDMASNRRVDVVALSAQPEAVRNLIPKVAKK